MKWLALTFSSALLGCALTTAGPGGPLRSGTSTQIQFTSAVSYGPAAATVGGVPVSGNGQTNQLGGKSVVDPLPNPVPVTIAVRQQVGASFEVSGDVGWVDSGVGLRLRLPSSERLPIVLSAGARSGEIGLFGRVTYQGTLAIESYPPLARNPEGSNGRRLVLSLGLADGAFEHDLSLPESFQSGSDAAHGFPSEIVIRREARLQAAVGVHLQGQHSAITLALQPWLVLAHDPYLRRVRRGHRAFDVLSAMGPVAAGDAGVHPLAIRQIKWPRPQPAAIRADVTHVPCLKRHPCSWLHPHADEHGLRAAQLPECSATPDIQDR